MCLPSGSLGQSLWDLEILWFQELTQIESFIFKWLQFYPILAVSLQNIVQEMCLFVLIVAIFCSYTISEPLISSPVQLESNRNPSKTIVFRDIRDRKSFALVWRRSSFGGSVSAKSNHVRTKQSLTCFSDPLFHTAQKTPEQQLYVQGHWQFWRYNFFNLFGTM